MERMEKCSEESGEQTISETNIATEIQMAQKRRKKYRNYARKCWNPQQTPDIVPKFRNKLFKKSASFQGHFFSEMKLRFSTDN